MVLAALEKPMFCQCGRAECLKQADCRSGCRWISAQALEYLSPMLPTSTQPTTKGYRENGCRSREPTKEAVVILGFLQLQKMSNDMIYFFSTV